jgi:hypothetical protein
MMFCKRAIVAACFVIATASCSSGGDTRRDDGNSQTVVSTQAVARTKAADPPSPSGSAPAGDTPDDPSDSKPALLLRGDPEDQRVSRGATGLTVRILASDLPPQVALMRLVLRYDSDVLVATTATCGSARAGHIALPDLTIPGRAEIGCSSLPLSVIYSPGETEVATVTFDAAQSAGRSALELEAMDLKDPDRVCLGGWGALYCGPAGAPLPIASITVE